MVTSVAYMQIRLADSVAANRFDEALAGYEDDSPNRLVNRYCLDKTRSLDLPS